MLNHDTMYVERTFLTCCIKLKEISSMNSLEVLALPQDGMLAHCRLSPSLQWFTSFTSTLLYSWGTMKVKSLAQEHNTKTWPGHKFRPPDSKSSTLEYATEPPSWCSEFSHYSLHCRMWILRNRLVTIPMPSSSLLSSAVLSRHARGWTENLWDATESRCTSIFVTQSQCNLTTNSQQRVIQFF